MQNMLRHGFRTALFSSLLLSALGSPVALAQGSSGGSVGNDEKSLSGSRETPRAIESSRPARRSRHEAEEPRRTTRKSGGGGGGGGSVDGAWVVTSVGCGGTGSGAIVITSGRIIGEGLTGSVGANGAARSVFQANGLTSIGSGRLSGRSGAGTFRRSDGCSGTWSAIKQ
ncbi:MAG: hypothetical protein V7632_2333 [Bradyrhizobium sp.]|jgi:hypothetical protein